ncbi:MAG: PASTA domain-containing protein [Clostridiales bacterium]|nr:PASTA domain-containing protein [Clostridiales bacterium]
MNGSLIGKVFNERYEILQQIGAGGMAVVYKAQDLVLDRTVTIKILRDEFANDADFVRRFKREARSVAGLSHENIVGFYDVGLEDNMQYIVMEYVEGTTLKEYIGKFAPLPVEEAVSIMCQILEGIQYAHEFGIIHRDIKSQNILLSSDGRVKVADFGIAVGTGDATHTFVGPSRIMGSVHYIAPEQVQGLSVNERTDIYAAGVIFFEMLTGRLPFAGDSPISIAMKHVQAEVEPPHLFNASVPLGLSHVVQRSMRKAPEMRYGSAGEMAQSIRSVMEPKPDSGEGENSALPPKTKINAQKPRRRRAVRWTSVLKLAVLLLILGAVGYGGQLAWNAFMGVLRSQEVAMPDLLNKTESEATALMDGAGLKYEIKRRHDVEVPLNMVISQGLPGGTMVKKNRGPVEIWVSDGPMTVLVPGVLGWSKRQAEIEIENRGLRCVIEEEYDDEVEAGIVISQSPAAGTSQPPESTVTIVVSLGPQSVPAPDVTGKTLQEAEALLQAENNFKIGLTEFEHNDDVRKDRVIRQRPREGVPAARGSEVDLVISLGPQPVPPEADGSGIPDFFPDLNC